MVIQRGSVCWADLGEPRGSRPAKRRPGNVFVPAAASGLPKDSVVNVTALVTLDKIGLDDAVGQLPPTLMSDVDRGLCRVMGL
jgi:mRNA interferase MazF